MKHIVNICLIVCCATLAACGGPTTMAANEGSSPPAVADEPAHERRAANSEENYREMLIQKANRLAQREIARMSAAELLYRNTPTSHRIMSAELGPNIGVHTKIYRAFNDFEITDIVRSDSYLNPVTYEITYAYDLLATEPRSFSTVDAEKLTRSDAQFKVIAKNKMTRHYPADIHGEFAGDLPKLPPRPDFYKLDADAGAGSEAPSMMGAPPMGMPPGAPPGMPSPSAVPPGLQPNFATGNLPGVRMIEPPSGPPQPK